MDSLSFLIGVLRLLGGFPYHRDHGGGEGGRGAWGQTWHVTDEGKEIRPTPKEERHPYRKSEFWVWWSRLFCVVILAYAAEYLWEILTGVQKYLQSSTIQFADKVRDGVTVLGLTSLSGHLLLKKSSALQLIERLQSCHSRRPMSRQNLGRNLCMALSALVFVAGNVMILENFLTSFIGKPSIPIANDILETTYYLLVTGFIMSFYYNAIYIMGDVYEDLISKLSQFQITASTTPRPCQGSFLAVKPRPRTAPVGRDDVASEPSKAAPEFLQEELLSDALETLTHMHGLQRLLHGYVGLPIIVIMQMSVVTTILSLFYLSFWGNVDGRLKILAVGYFINSVLPPLILCNIPVVLQCRVDALNVLVGSLRRYPVYQCNKDLIDELAFLLNEFPGFKLYHLFTLGRSAIVDVFSFIATYFIILLQFRASEKSL